MSLVVHCGTSSLRSCRGLAFSELRAAGSAHRRMPVIGLASSRNVCGETAFVHEMIHVRKSTEADFAAMLAIINEAARAYHGVIPIDQWHEPYMPADELEREIAQGVVFWVAEEQGHIAGVMGIQDKGDVALVRHAYVAPTTQRTGVGTRLLRHVQGLVKKPILIGTWAAASWAIEFYRRNGFTCVTADQNDRLLRTYWSIPARQIETSVVLADDRWMEAIMAPSK